MKSSKYGSKKTTVDGIEFDSKREAERWSILKMIQLGGEISDLQRQMPLSIIINGIKVCDFICDFVYVETKSGKTIHEDSKGFKTPVYRLKKRLVRASLGIDIMET